MHPEPIALHEGYQSELNARSVAAPIYQTIAYEFDSASHAAALFNLEAAGFRYSRVSNPTVAVLERRIAALKGGVGALCLASGQAAIHAAILALTDVGRNIVSVPQLYGTTHTLFAHVLSRTGVTLRFADSNHPEDIAPLINDATIAVYCESVGNPAGNVATLRPRRSRPRRRRPADGRPSASRAASRAESPSTMPCDWSNVLSAS